MITHQYALPRSPARVVLLGAHGFIGTALRSQIEAQGVEVLSPTSAEINLSKEAADCELEGLLKPSDAVVMLAAVTPDKGRDVDTLMKNIAMMKNVCAAIEKSGCAHFVYFSSDAVYNSGSSRVAEDIHASPQDLYGAMHHTREIMARRIGKVPLLILRPTLVYGAEDTHNSYGPNRFRRAARQAEQITLFGRGEETRDHIHVDDVAALALRCLLHTTSGTLNVATGVSKSFFEIAEIVAKQFGKSIEIITTPRVDPITHRHFDVTRLIKTFPDFRFVTIEDGLARVHRQTAGEV
jgi:UDP-glucose 4-epimerase